MNNRVNEEPQYEVPPTRQAPGFVQPYWGSYEHVPDGGWYYRNLFSAPFAVSMNGVDDKDIIQVTMRERTESDPESPYWGWESFEEVDQDRPYCLIYERFFLLEMCFAYGSKAEVDRGKGRPVNLVIDQHPG